jgi:hypothetical protein
VVGSQQGLTRLRFYQHGHGSNQPGQAEKSKDTVKNPVESDSDLDNHSLVWITRKIKALNPGQGVSGACYVTMAGHGQKPTITVLYSGSVQ